MKKIIMNCRLSTSRSHWLHSPHFLNLSTTIRSTSSFGSSPDLPTTLTNSSPVKWSKLKDWTISFLSSSVQISSLALYQARNMSNLPLVNDFSMCAGAVYPAPTPHSKIFFTMFKGSELRC